MAWPEATSKHKEQVLENSSNSEHLFNLGEKYTIRSTAWKMTLRDEKSNMGKNVLQ